MENDGSGYGIWDIEGIIRAISLEERCETELSTVHDITSFMLALDHTFYLGKFERREVTHSHTKLSFIIVLWCAIIVYLSYYRAHLSSPPRAQ